jgi:hypothetical protein
MSSILGSVKENVKIPKIVVNDATAQTLSVDIKEDSLEKALIENI